METALAAVEEIRGEAVEATVEGRLRAAFREMGYDSGSERKVSKVIISDGEATRRHEEGTVNARK